MSVIIIVIIIYCLSYVNTSFYGDKKDRKHCRGYLSVGRHVTALVVDTGTLHAFQHLKQILSVLKKLNFFHNLIFSSFLNLQ